MSIEWIKIKTNMFDDTKIRLIESMEKGDSILVVWLKLLAIAGKNNDGGEIYLTKNKPYTMDMLSTIMNRPKEVIENVINTLTHFEMIDISRDGKIMISNWEKHQNVDQMEKIKEQTRERVRKHRERKALEDSNVTETLQVTLRNAPEKKRKEKNYIGHSDERPKNDSYSDDFKEFWSNYPRKVGKIRAYECWDERKKKDKIPPEELIKASKNYARYCEEKNKDKDHILHPKTFLSKKLDYQDYVDYQEEKPKNKEDKIDKSIRAQHERQWELAGFDPNDPRREEWIKNGADVSELYKRAR